MTRTELKGRWRLTITRYTDCLLPVTCNPFQCLLLFSFSSFSMLFIFRLIILSNCHYLRIKKFLYAFVQSYSVIVGTYLLPVMCLNINTKNEIVPQIICSYFIFFGFDSAKEDILLIKRKRTFRATSLHSVSPQPGKKTIIYEEPFDLVLWT